MAAKASSSVEQEGSVHEDRDMPPNYSFHRYPDYLVFDLNSLFSPFCLVKGCLLSFLREGAPGNAGVSNDQDLPSPWERVIHL